ncbi:hypothetical protein [Bacteroides sp. UBA939]|uniref:hypothetical protein n=1 Tax=Bacteroides sp. UBA939 TaxID=1946092 RepID=UPI0025C6818C|nr:hypothetical protein [Bacteroides sp. UBA939]
MNRIVKTIIFIAILAGFAGCSEETMEEIPVSSTIPEGYIRAALDLQVEENNLIQTRANATEEQAYDDSNVWVLLFKANSITGTPLHLLQAPAKATKLGDKLYVLLRSVPDHVALYVVTGLTADLNNVMANIPENTSFFDVNDALQTAAVPATGVPIGGTSYIPMSSDCALYSSGTASITSITLPLIRSVAKLNVDASAINTAEFQLEGVTLVNAAKQGYVLRQVEISPNYTVYNTQQYEEKTSISGNKLTSEIYMYENADMYSNGVTQVPTKIIIKGKYKGGASSYYRIDLLKRNANGTYTPYNIERNHCYVLTINKIDNAGYINFEQALANEPSNKWPQTNVAVTDANSSDIVSNGRYYLGVTNSEFIIYGNTTATQTVVVVTSNAPSGTPTSITASGLAILQTSLQTPNGTARATSITANLSNVAVGDSAYIDLRVGDLTQRITIQKRAGVGTAFSDITDFSEKKYVAGKVNSGTGMRFATKPEVDFSSCCNSLVHPGFYIRCNSGTGALGDLYISRANNEGRVKVSVYR